MGIISLKLPEKLHERLKKYKQETGVSVNDYCYRAISKLAMEDGLIRLHNTADK